MIVQGAGEFGLGLRLSAGSSVATQGVETGAPSAPLFVVEVDAGSPAARAGLRPGDIVTAIDGLPPVVAGRIDQVVLAQLDGPATTHLVVRRPSSGRLSAVTLTPGPYASPQPVTARVLQGHVAYVRLTSFVDNAANFAFAALDGLGLDRRVRGLVLDLRGNGGGAAGEPARLLGAFAPHAVFAYLVDGHGHREAERTARGMPPVHVPLVVLIDRGCASACDVTAAAVRDLHLGRLVGERTAGDAAGPAVPWFLGDGGILLIPVGFMHGAGGEIVDGIGVPPDEAAPATAAALSAGHDPALEQAQRDLRREGR
jgi:carboxyl-terminal processing protease